MKWIKPSQQTLDTFEKIVPLNDKIEHRKMFGLPCVFIHGNMMMGVHNNNIVMRLPESDREEFLKIKGAMRFEPMPGRIMKEYVVIPAQLLNNASKLGKWIESSRIYVSALPLKEAKKSARKK